MPAPPGRGACPLPLTLNDDCIRLEHGEGGRATRQFIEQHILPRFDNRWLNSLGDAAQLELSGDSIAMTTDSFVVSPLFFPGGDIGSLAVHGTLNDLAVSGARPRWLTMSLIIEEGFPIPALDRILQSAAAAAENAGVAIVAGDTKVVPKGAADGLFITATGVGQFVDKPFVGPSALVPGDELIVSGPIGRHGIAVLVAREDMQFDPLPQSDSASLVSVVEALRRMLIPVRALRDATRGGVAAVLHEWTDSCGHGIRIDEPSIPVTEDVRGVCELLGLDPLHMACEGTFVAAVENGASAAAIEAMRTTPAGKDAALIGVVLPRTVNPVVIRRSLGPDQPLDDPLGTPVPRIC